MVNKCLWLNNNYFMSIYLGISYKIIETKKRARQGTNSLSYQYFFLCNPPYFKHSDSDLHEHLKIKCVFIPLLLRRKTSEITSKRRRHYNRDKDHDCTAQPGVTPGPPHHGELGVLVLGPPEAERVSAPLWPKAALLMLQANLHPD